VDQHNHRTLRIALRDIVQRYAAMQLNQQRSRAVAVTPITSLSTRSNYSDGEKDRRQKIRDVSASIPSIEQGNHWTSFK
jgi:hypothetical protein